MSKNIIFLTFCILCIAVMTANTEEVWIEQTIEGFSFSYPDYWEYNYIGKENMGGLLAIMLELKYTEELRCIIRVLLIPEMMPGVIPGGSTFKDFLLLVLQDSLKKMGDMGKNIEPAEARMKHGQVFAFKSLSEDDEKNISNLFVACGDMIDNAAIIVFWGISCELDKMILAEINSTIIDKIVSTFAFPAKG